MNSMANTVDSLVASVLGESWNTLPPRYPNRYTIAAFTLNNLPDGRPNIIGFCVTHMGGCNGQPLAVVASMGCTLDYELRPELARQLYAAFKREIRETMIEDAVRAQLPGGNGDSYYRIIEHLTEEERTEVERRFVARLRVIASRLGPCCH